MARYELTDDEWSQIEPLLPPTHPGKPGHPWKDHRLVLNGILWILRSGAPWEDLPARYGSSSTCNDRLRRWQQDGTWDRILQAVQAKHDHEGNVVWIDCSIDGSSIRAHQHAAGARKQKKGSAAGRTEIYGSVVSTEPARSPRRRRSKGRTRPRSGRSARA